MKPHRLLKTAQRLREQGDTVTDLVATSKNPAVSKAVDRLVNLRGKGVRFVRMHGRIVPIRVK